MARRETIARGGNPGPEEDGGGRRLPRIGITLGDPRGIGPEVVHKALADPRVRRRARFLVLGYDGIEPPGECDFEAVERWHGDAEDDEEAGRVAGRAIERGIDSALAGEVDGLVTAPISKRALAAAGYSHPGHTELLRERTGVPEVTMMMAAERTRLGGPLRLALLTGHLPLREVPRRLSTALAITRTRLAVSALREWWGLARPRVAFAGMNPHASEGGRFGDEEARVLEPAAAAIAAEGAAEVHGVFPADTVFRRCIDGASDLVVVPYHDVGLAVLKTVALETGVNVTAGLPFPRTSPDHGTAFDIAGRGVADPGSTIAALELCIRFCRAGAAAPDGPGVPADGVADPEDAGGEARE